MSVLLAQLLLLLPMLLLLSLCTPKVVDARLIKQLQRAGHAVRPPGIPLSLMGRPAAGRGGGHKEGEQAHDCEGCWLAGGAHGWAGGGRHPLQHLP